MGYMLHLFAARVDALEQRLRKPTATTGPAAELARLIARGGGTPTEEQTLVVDEILTETGETIGIVNHSSSGGTWFRDEVIGGPFAARYGGDLAEHLIHRPLAGLEWDAYPSVGWVLNADLPAASARPLRSADPQTDGVLQTIDGALKRIRASGKDLVTYYS